MNIYQMIPGKQYNCNDGYGYDQIEMMERKFDQKIGMDVVVVKYLATGQKDTWFENPEYGFHIYVEEI